MPATPEQLAEIRRAQAALKRLDSDRNWRDWEIVGDGVMAIRQIAMHESGVNRPYGRGYTEAFGRLWTHYKFADRIKDPGDRSRLIDVMENLPAIQAWRQQLSADDRRRWTHPSTVWREYQKARKQAAAVPEADNLWKKPSAKEEIKALKAQIHELRKGGDLPWGPDDSPEDQARALFEQIGIADAERLALAILALAKAHRDDASVEGEHAPAEGGE